MARVAGPGPGFLGGLRIKHQYPSKEFGQEVNIAEHDPEPGSDWHST